MTETRKKIIEIIEPYMDKTLSDYCLIESLDSCWDVEIRGKLHLTDYFLNNQNNKLIKIIGHYDITAVLKYIQTFDIVELRISLTRIYLWIDGHQINEENEPNFIFELKPLHLYTEQQDTELLQLLTKLNNA